MRFILDTSAELSIILAMRIKKIRDVSRIIRCPELSDKVAEYVIETFTELLGYQGKVTKHDKKIFIVLIITLILFAILLC